MGAAQARPTSRSAAPGRLQLCIFLWPVRLLLLASLNSLFPELSVTAATNEIHPDPVSPEQAIPELPKLWIPFFEVRAGVGYKDNLLLSHAATEQSGFVTAGADVSVARLPLDGRQFNLLVSGDDRRYWRGQDVDHEDLALALAQGKLGLGTAWQYGLDLRYLYQDEVVDTSVTETNLEATRVRGHLAGALPNVRWNFARGAWAEVSGAAQRGWYAAPLDDYWEGGPKVAL